MKRTIAIELDKHDDGKVDAVVQVKKGNTVSEEHDLPNVSLTILKYYIAVGVDTIWREALDGDTSEG